VIDRVLVELNYRSRERERKRKREGKRFDHILVEN